ncbi:MAG: two-component system response regulator [Anaerolineaceae bacterium 4572_5.1]|nr:MAG: two-component system response regulator [Anaerolineaceae bacterium 4572_5.1]
MPEKKLIICIEDEPEMTELVQIILQREGYEVLGARGGQAGLDLIQERIPDLVLLDLMMPDMDGWEVYQKLQADEKTSDIPVIVVTAKAQSIDKVLGLHVAKVDDYMTKPFKPDELSERVKKVLDANS